MLSGHQRITASLRSFVMIGEPPPTPADLHFRAFGVPVRVHPWFWIVMIFLGLGGGGPADPLQTVLWVVAGFAAVLVHELGHAYLQTRYGGHPRIILYGFGGLAACDDCDRSPRSQILISLAGPVAGLIFATAVVVFVRAAGHRITFLPSPHGNDWSALADRGFDSAVEQPLIFISAFFEPFASRPLNHLVADLLQVNILWGVINLFPIYPLDGGRIAREFLTLRSPRQGIISSLWLSIAAAGTLALWGLSRGSLYTAILFGYLGYSSYQMLQAYQNRQV
jgi:Zn-dependent protease